MYECRVRRKDVETVHSYNDIIADHIIIPQSFSSLLSPQSSTLLHLSFLSKHFPLLQVKLEGEQDDGVGSGLDTDE